MYRAGQFSPGARLLAAAGFARPGRPAADIGCDHGKLSVYLAAKESCPFVVAVDSRPLPLARARALVRQAGLESKVSCRLGWGLSPLAPGEAEDLFIAGLSGETMVEILAGAVWPDWNGVRLVLAPTARAPQLRRWLLENGFAVVAERPVEEKKRYYTVLCCDYTGQPQAPDPLFCEVGLLPGVGGAAARALVGARLAYLRQRQKAPLEAGERQELIKLTGEVEECLKLMK